MPLLLGFWIRRSAKRGVMRPAPYTAAQYVGKLCPVECNAPGGEKLLIALGRRTGGALAIRASRASQRLKEVDELGYRKDPHSYTDHDERTDKSYRTQPDDRLFQIQLAAIGSRRNLHTHLTARNCFPPPVGSSAI